ncbi:MULTISPECIES: HdeD family acid-resistance protein [Rhodomicrobium]|uniref:HdeD family acid-resistance protein n=1 Tax=Rhodomicrobium TaxID=1068 RepID=UPI000B4B2231|nr:MULTISPECIES: HdeD family acid-resistance protein [Rhodomicrobium]
MSDTGTAEVNVRRKRQASVSDDWLNDVKSTVLAQNWWLIALRGVLGILFGVIAIVMPQITLLALVMLFAAYMLVDGVLAIISAVREARQGQRWALLVVEGLLRIGVAALALLWPGITILAFVLIIAVWSIVSGALMIATALRLNRRYGRGWMGLSGFLSVVFGILLMAAPPVGAIVLTWWLGIYVAAFNVAMLILAFRLRSRRHETPQDVAAAAQSA